MGLRLLAFGRFHAFAAACVIRHDQVNWGDAERAGQLEQCNNCWIASASFEAANILLREAGNFSKTLLGEALGLPQSLEVSADQLAHIHLRKLRLYIL